MFRVLRQPALTAWVLLGLTVLTGCVDSIENCGELPSELEVTLSASSLTPSTLELCRGAAITLTVHPEVDGILHVHGYDADLPATPVAADIDAVLEFTASRSGQFPIELHTDENMQGVSVGILTVHEP